MSMFEVLQRFGTTTLMRHAAGAALFLVLHLVRMPLVLVARVLEASMRRIDAYVTNQAGIPPTRPINQFFQTTPGFPRREATHVRA